MKKVPDGKERKKASLTGAEYKHMIASAAVPFAIIEVLFLAVAVYLFVRFPKTPLYGGVFAGLAVLFALVCVAVLLVLRAGCRRAKRREDTVPRTKDK